MLVRLRNVADLIVNSIYGSIDKSRFPYGGLRNHNRGEQADGNPANRPADIQVSTALQRLPNSMM